MNWPVEHDGFEYEPIPPGWIEHENAYDANHDERLGPDTYAVSAALYGSRTLRVRYLQPRTENIYITQTGAIEREDGHAPEALATGRWPRSRITQSQPNDVARKVELDHFWNLWDERLFDGDRPLRADGGQTDRPDPEDDPSVCSLCGTYLGTFSEEYCDGCAREIGAKPPLRRCIECGQRGPEEQMRAIDVSLEDEYYPTFEYLCRGCGGDPGGEQP